MDHDEAGQNGGFFVPAGNRVAPESALPEERWMYEWARTQICDEELERTLNETEFFTTAEVLKNLKSQ